MATTRQKAKLTLLLRQHSAVTPATPAADSADTACLDHITAGFLPMAPHAELPFMVDNAVKHSEKHVEGLRFDLRQFGHIEPLIVDCRDDRPTVIGGNGRFQSRHASLAELAKDKDLTSQDDALNPTPTLNPPVSNSQTYRCPSCGQEIVPGAIQRNPEFTTKSPLQNRAPLESDK